MEYITEKIDTIESVRSIVVVRPNHRLGNTLLLTPLISDLERRFPGAEIDLITAGGAAQPVFEQFSQIKSVHSFPGKSFRHPGRVLKTLFDLRRRTYDLAIDPIPHSKAGRFLLGRVFAHRRIGFGWNVASRDRMLTHSVSSAAAPAHFAQAPLYLLQSIFSSDRIAVASPRVGSKPLDLRLTETELQLGRQRMAAALGSSTTGGPILGLFAHATGNKCFPVEWWRELATTLCRENPRIQIVEFVPEDGRPRLGEGYPRLQTPDLRLLGALLAATSKVVVADGGIMHLADAAGARVLGLFKWSDPARYGPCGASSESVWAVNSSINSIADKINADL